MSKEAPPANGGERVDSTDVKSRIQLSRAEAKQAWLSTGGNTERAAKLALTDRLAKVTNKTI